MLARGARPLARASPLRDTSRVWTHSTVPCALTAENLLQVCTHLAMWHESAAEISHMHARCFSEQRNRVGCSAAPLLNINLPFFCVLSLQLHVCNVWQDAGRAPDQPRGSWEREKLGRHLITGPHQMLELFTHRAWNFVCGEMIYNFTLTAGGGERERETLRKGRNTYLVFFLFASKFLNGFQALIIFHSMTAITQRGRERETRAMKSTWYLVGLRSWRQWSFADAVYAWVHKIIMAHHAGPAIELASTNGDQLYINSYFEGKLKLMVLAHSHEG